MVAAVAGHLPVVAVAHERLEMEELEAGRASHRAEIELAKQTGSRTVAMLDQRVGSMLANLRAELESAESDLGEHFHSLDLDGDGVLSKEELLNSIESLHRSKRPDAKAFQALLDQIDIDHDGKISVEDFRRLVKEMNLRDDEEPINSAASEAKKKRSSGGGGGGG